MTILSSFVCTEAYVGVYKLRSAVPSRWGHFEVQFGAMLTTTVLRSLSTPSIWYSP